MGTWGLLFFSPVSRRTTLQAFRLEWVKSIACTVSTHLSCHAESRCSISAVDVSCFSCSVVAAWCFSARSSHSLSHPGICIFQWPLGMCSLAVLMFAEINWQYASSISGVFGSGSSNNNLQVSFVKSSQ